MKKLWMGALLAALGGCGGKHAAEHREMQAMASKIRAYVEQQVSELNIKGAGWAANASCMFAREMDCVAGKSPDTSPGGKDVMRTESLSEFKERIKRTVLDPKGLIEIMSVSGYDKVLGWMLTEEELSRLKAIREKCGYWDELKTALKPK